jgi:hypothetical protein
MRAMTVRRRVYVDPVVLSDDPSVLGLLLIHEFVHVRQWAHAGPVRFLARYLWDYTRGRLTGRSHLEAYRSIRYEAEARAIAGV